MTDRDELFLARTDAVHEKLTEWIEAIQKQSPDELANFMSRRRQFWPNTCCNA